MFKGIKDFLKSFFACDYEEEILTPQEKVAYDFTILALQNVRSVTIRKNILKAKYRGRTIYIGLSQYLPSAWCPAITPFEIEVDGVLLARITRYHKEYPRLANLIQQKDNEIGAKRIRAVSNKTDKIMRELENALNQQEKKNARK